MADSRNGVVVVVDNCSAPAAVVVAAVANGDNVTALRSTIQRLRSEMNQWNILLSLPNVDITFVLCKRREVQRELEERWHTLAVAKEMARLEPLWRPFGPNHTVAKARGADMWWCVMSAAYSFRMSRRFATTYKIEDRFKAYLWCKKAALQGHKVAQVHTGLFLLLIERELLGAQYTVGYNSVPEALFWLRMGQSRHVDRYEAMIQKCCGYCRKRRNHGTATETMMTTTAAMMTLEVCTKCRAVAYCSKECQAKHWELSHAVDCRQVAALKRAMGTTTTD